MHLKKLELCGFKSFADRTAFDFDEGVTALVGPNGCGKSNVVDAFRWILGEQSAKAVRGAQMADVIFNGTANRRSLGYAEASLTFENSDGTLASEYTDVCVTRRLYRSGESEYLLNKKPCRLRDIRQLFMDTGVGVDTYSIIEQGKVDRFIQANSKQRRVLFEEAAGISRYKAQRKEAQSRLERAATNLSKVDIKLDEQRKQLRSIKYQAAKARRYHRHSKRLRQLVVALSSKNYREWSARREDLDAAIDGLEERHAALSEDLRTLEEQVRVADSETARIESVARERRDDLHKVDAALDAAEASIRHNGQRVVEYEEDTERCTRAIWALTEKLRVTEEELAEAVKELEAIREVIAQQAAAIASETEKAMAAGEECDRLGAAIEEWKNHTIQVIERATTLRNELNHMDRGRREQLARRARLMGQLEEKTLEAGRITGEVENLTGHRDEITNRLADRRLLLERKSEDLTRLSGERDTLDARLRDLRHREAECLSRREILQDIETRSEDVESGVKRLLRDQPEEEHAKVLGMVADLVRADLEYAVAIEAALGESAQYVVTLTESDAGAAAALLRTDKAGRAGLMPVSRVRASEYDALHLFDEPGVVGPATQCVRYEPRLEPVVRHLLGDTWIVKDLDTALKLSGNGGRDMRFVTLDGERAEPGGAVIGGEPLPRIGIVSRKSELEALESELGALATDTTRLEEDRGRMAQQITSLQSDVAELRNEIEQGNLEQLTNENEILNLRRRQKALSDEAELLQSELAEIDEAVRAYDEREKAIEVELEDTSREQERLQAEVESARRNLAEHQAVTARLREEVTRLKVELADKEARCGGLQQSIESARRAREEVTVEIGHMKRRMEDVRGKQREAEAAIERSKAEIETLNTRRIELQSEIRQLAEEQANAQSRRAECMERLRSVRMEQEEVREQLQSQRLQAQELRVRMESLSEQVYSEHGIRLEDFVQQPMSEILGFAGLEDAADDDEDEDAARPVESVEAAAAPASEAAAPEGAVAVAVEAAPVEFVEPDWKAVEAEIAELREKIRRMGGINEESINEEEGLEIAIRDTEAQKEDLVKAEAQLREVIRKLNRMCREKFRKTFEEVRANFQETFRRLFGGGKADLQIVEDENSSDILDAGIEVYACPPGKEVRSITLMSGGEKTMTTIALIFAIFRSKPSPFCILDEVDAALDEANIDRFTGMLEEFINESQFIIITHSKRTIGIAKVMYGITMQEKGVSKRVAVSLEGTQVQNN